MRFKSALIVLAAGIGAAALGACDHEHSADRARASSPPKLEPVQSPRPPERVPLTSDVRRAREFAATRGAAVSFAVIDSRGGAHGFREALPFQSASVTKSMLLADF